MAVMSPITTFADEAQPDGDGDPATQDESTKKEVSTVADAAKKEATEADHAVEDASDACDDAADVILGTTDSGDSGSENSGSGESQSQESGSDESQSQDSGSDESQSQNSGSEAEAPQEAASTDDGGAVAQPAVADFIEAAQTVADDTAEGGTFDTAQDHIEKANENLSTVNEADAAYQESAADMAESAQEAIKIAELAESSVEDAGKKIDELSTSVSNAESVEDAQEAFNTIAKIVTDTNADIEVKQQALNKLKKSFDDAQAKLIEAAKNYNDALSGAATEAKAAEEDLVTAKQHVDALESTLEEAQKKLAEEKAAADDIKAKQKTVLDKKNETSNWNPTRELLQSFVMNYYIPQIQNDGATNISYKTVEQGFDKQNCNHATVTYTDKDGNQVTKYFNYDRDTRKNNENDRWDGVSNKIDKGIVIYEKSAEEVGASDYAKQYYKKYADGLGSSGGLNWKQRVNSGEFDVFAYEKGGETVFKMRDELKDLEPNENGNYVIDGIELHKVVQSTKFNASVKYDLQNDGSFISFLDKADALVEKYNGYTDEVAAAKTAVTEAQKQAGELTSAIDAIEKKGSLGDMSAKKVLGVDSIAAYLGLDLPGDEASKLDNMTIDQIKDFLDDKLDDAEKKLEDAKDNLKDLEEKKDAAEKELEEVKERLTPPAPAPAQDTNTEDENKTPEKKSSNSSNTNVNTPAPAPAAEEAAVPAAPAADDAADDTTAAPESAAPEADTPAPVFAAIPAAAVTNGAPAANLNILPAFDADEEVLGAQRLFDGGSEEAEESGDVLGARRDGEELSAAKPAKVQTINSKISPLDLGGKKTFSSIPMMDGIRKGFNLIWIFILSLVGGITKGLFDRKKEENEEK